MIDHSSLYQTIQKTPLSPWLDKLPQQVAEGFNARRWGDLPKWMTILEKLPNITPSSFDFNGDSIVIGKKEDCEDKVRKELEELLRQYHPWRKGPFDIFGIHIDTEWRSDIKWNRLKSQIQPLKDRLVLDIGCGSGYHCWRMLGDEAKLVIGADPTLLYVMQFNVFQKYVHDPRIAVLPIGVDDLPTDLNYFDTVFSMGLLYHRRSPLDHLLQLKSYLRKNGELVLETLVIDGEKGQVLNPKERYAKMPNVWFIPSVPTLESWLIRMGFTDVRCVDVAQTTSEEQRVTDWMGFQSLADFLDPHDPSKTIEGYPAPKRAVFLANNKD